MDNLDRFLTACRENTGRAMCDSGDYYGRHWQSPAIDKDAPLVTWSEAGMPATIETGHFLAACFDVDEELEAKWLEWEPTCERAMSYFEATHLFMESLGYAGECKDNTYNGENDLSQTYVWEVYVPVDEGCSDWLYAENAVTVIFIHTGCDVRGGYTVPIFCRSKGDYPVPTELCASYYALDGRDYKRIKYPRTHPTELFDHAGLTVEQTEVEEDGPAVLDHNSLSELTNKWSCGYSSCPYAELEKDVKRWFEFTRTEDSVCAQLVCGALVKIQPWAEVPC